MAKKKKIEIETGGIGDELVCGLLPRSEWTIDDVFEDFHRRHPGIWEEFSKKAKQLYRMGFRLYSSDRIIHWIRLEADLVSGPVEKDQRTVPMVDDHLTSCYADKFRALDPKYKNFFPDKTKTRRRWGSPPISNGSATSTKKPRSGAG